MLTQRVRVGVGNYFDRLDALLDTAVPDDDGINQLYIPRPLRVKMPNFEYTWREALLLDRRDTFIVRESGPEDLLELHQLTRDRPVLAAECAIRAKQLGGTGMDVAWPEPTPPFIPLWAALFWRYGVAADEVDARDSAMLMLIQFAPAMPPTTLEWAEEIASVIRKIFEASDAILKPRVARWLTYLPM